MIKIQDGQLKIIIDILNKFVPNCEVRAYGSRYKGNSSEYSDLDLAIVGKEKLDWKLLVDLKEAFEESDLPFRVDVLDWYGISEEFRNVIEAGYEVLKVKEE
jgi:predicted nucleotidyltransferase